MDMDDTDLVENVSVHVSCDTMPLNIRVKLSETFLDTTHYNKNIHFYGSRSKKRGRVFIFNNYDYVDKEAHPYRNGAQVDSRNLHKLFNQMGGWEIHQRDNTTIEVSILSFPYN